MYFRDDWPKMPDGHDFDGRHLLTLVRRGHSPFHDKWDVNLLIQEIEEHLLATVIEIPCISSGSNNYVSYLERPSFLHVPNADIRPYGKRDFTSSYPMIWTL